MGSGRSRSVWLSPSSWGSRAPPTRPPEVLTARSKPLTRRPLREHDRAAREGRVFGIRPSGKGYASCSACLPACLPAWVTLRDRRHQQARDPSVARRVPRRYPPAWVAIVAGIAGVLATPPADAYVMTTGSRLAATSRPSNGVYRIWAGRSDGHLVRLELDSDDDEYSVWEDLMAGGTPAAMNTRGADGISWTNGPEQEHVAYVGADNRLYAWRLVNGSPSVARYISFAAPAGQTFTGHVAIGRRLDRAPRDRRRRRARLSRRLLRGGKRTLRRGRNRRGWCLVPPRRPRRHGVGRRGSGRGTPPEHRRLRGGLVRRRVPRGLVGSGT